MLPYDLAILFPEVYPTEMCTCDHPETGVFIAVLFEIAPHWKLFNVYQP